MIIPTKLVKVVANGKRYIYLSEDKGKVRVKGEIVKYSGHSAHHGPDKVFMKDRVEITECDYTEELLKELWGQEEIRMVETVVVKPKGRRKWVKNGMLTAHARKQLELEGYDVAMDGLGNYLDEDMLEDAAMDSIAYHSELTADGVKEGYNSLREAAADSLHEGMVRAAKECNEKGRNTHLTR